MKKLVTLFVFLVITGWTTACGDSLVGLAGHGCDGDPSPNGWCDDGGDE